MSDYQHKPNSGSIFPNKYKERDAQPDWTGTALIDSKEYRIAAWENEGRDGNLYYAMKFEEKGEWDRRRDRTDRRGWGAAPTTGHPTDPGAARRAAAVAAARGAVRRLGADPGQRTMADSFDDIDKDDIPF